MMPVWEECVEIGSCTLYRGDSRLIVPEVEQCEAVVADPPYGIDHDCNYKRFTGGAAPKNEYRQISGDQEPFNPEWLLGYDKVVLWGANCYSDKLPCGSWLVWCKRRESKIGKFMSDCEVAWMKGGHGTYLFHHIWDGFDRESERGKSLHPTQKPVELMKWCIEKTKANSVIDPYMGSGPVAIAAKVLGKRYIGIEMDKGYFDIACKRVNDVHELMNPAVTPILSA